MMQQLRNPKNVKVISLFIAAIFVLGCFALSVTQSGFGKNAMAASSESAIGVVNYQMIVSQSPDLNSVNDAMQKEIAYVIGQQQQLGLNVLLCQCDWLGYL